MPRGGHHTTREEPSHDVKLSKKLSWLLRHNLVTTGLASKCRTDGFVQLNDVLALPHFRGFTVPQVRAVVTANDKQRFALINDDAGELWIRANQGHSAGAGTAIDADALLTRVTRAEELPRAVHGTYYKWWGAIGAEGLCRMTRQHIHLAKGGPGEPGVTSGVRSDVELLIEVDVAVAMEAGVAFFVSANGVILTPGLGPRGLLPPRFFREVTDLRTCELILLPPPPPLAGATVAEGTTAVEGTTAPSPPAVVFADGGNAKQRRAAKRASEGGAGDGGGGRRAMRTPEEIEAVRAERTAKKRLAKASVVAAAAAAPQSAAVAPGPAAIEKLSTQC